MTKTSQDNDEDFQFAAEVAVRISQARDEFFAFMKSFDDDLSDLRDPQRADQWFCLINYFREWTHAKIGWTWGYLINAETGQVTYQPGYHGPGTREFEEFNALLPHILLAVIDEALRFPELLDASPFNQDGSLRRQFRRSIPFIFDTKAGREKTLRDSPDWDKHGDEIIMFGMLFEPFPPIHKVTFD
jgi:hypothetical protein